MPPSPQDQPDASHTASGDKNSYGQILRSSALIGGASVVNIALGVVRTKVMALLLGPSGVGLIGLYSSIVDLTVSIVGLGINSSGVRQIAAAVGEGDHTHIAHTITVLRRTSLVLGLAGLALLVLFSSSIAIFTFETEQQSAAVALLSLAVLFRLISAGQGAVLQGMRRISDLAKMGMLGTLFGLLIGIPLVYVWRERGVVPALVAIAAMSVVTSWWYSRRVQVQTPQMATSDVRREATALLKLGVAFMASGILMMGAAYAVRTMVVRLEGIEAAGFYQSAWTLGGLYVGFILQAMGADFYPRLTAVAHDHTTVNRLVNEQARISLLLAGPGVLATLTFAPLATTMFYSAEFAAAAEVLRWMCLGTLLQVITWPMGFIIVAKNERRLFFLVELAWAVVNIALSWICIQSFGLRGAGIAFAASYIFHAFLLYPIVRRLSGFQWSAANQTTGLLFLAVATGVFAAFFALPSLLSIGLGAAAVLGTGLYSLHILRNLVAIEHIPRPIRRLLVWFRPAPSSC